MNPAPLCKTAILAFIIDHSLLTLWNVSSNMRKRIQMVLADREIIVSEYSPKLLALKHWIRLGTQDIFIQNISDVKKGVSNYRLNSQEAVDKIVSLNNGIRCYSMDFQPEQNFVCDSIRSLVVNSYNYDFLLNFPFKRICFLSLDGLSPSQVVKFLSKPTKVDYLYAYKQNISNLDLAPFKILKISFSQVNFSGKVNLPSNLEYLEVSHSEGLSSLNVKRVNKIYIWNIISESEDTPAFISKLKHLKRASITLDLEKHIESMPSSVREIKYSSKCDFSKLNLPKIKANLPFLINLDYQTQIEAGGAFNLRVIEPVIAETKEMFSYRPRYIKVNEFNLGELNKHPELFENTEKLLFYYGELNFDCLTEKIKKIRFEWNYQGKGDFDSLRRNNWKLKEAEIDIQIMCGQEETVRAILSSLGEVKKVILSKSFDYLRKDYPEIKFATR